MWLVDLPQPAEMLVHWGASVPDLNYDNLVSEETLVLWQPSRTEKDSTCKESKKNSSDFS